MRVTLLVLLLTACGSKNEACLEYTKTVADCAATAESAGANMDMQTDDADAFCDEFGDDYDELGWNCLIKTWSEADCSTDEGLAELLMEADTC